MSITVTIEGYLVQAKLESALKAIVGAEAWRGTEQPVVAGRKRRWDMVFHGVIGKVAVEFDGPDHYRDALKIKADLEKDGFAREGAYRVVRVPYWVQLTTPTLKHYFDLDANIVQDFPHGFIAKTAPLPASFCEMGVERFLRELDQLPDHVRGAVVKSLGDRADEHGIEYVLPSALRSLIE